MSVGGWTIADTVPLAAAVPGLTTVSSTNVSNSARVKTAVATCPSGTVLIGGGFQLGVPNNTGEVHVPEVRPVGNRIVVVAYEDRTGFAGNWTVTATAICADPLPGLEVVTSVSVTDSVTFKGTFAYCPAGKELVGTAAAVSGGRGRVVLNRIDPAPTNLYAFAHEDQSGTANVWNVVAYAFCADALPGHEIVTAQSPTTTAASKSVTAECPEDKGILGAGAVSPERTGEIVIEDMNPYEYQGRHEVRVDAADDGDGYSGSFWRVDGFAICADL